MNRKFWAGIFLIALMTIFSPADAVFADEWNSSAKVATIDTAWEGSSLEASMKSLNYYAYRAEELYISAGTLTDDDIMWITESMSSLKVLSITGAASFADGNLPDGALTAYEGAVLSNLESVTIDTDDGVLLSFGNRAFYECEKLTAVNIPVAGSFGDHAFGKCQLLATISLPRAESFGNSAFISCAALSQVNLPKASTFGDNAFYSLSGIASINLPQAKAFGDSAFCNCQNLAGIDLPKAETFGDQAFYNCDSLVNVDLYEAAEFGDDAFRYSANIESINLPKATTLGDDFCREASKLVSVTMPQAARFGSYSFHKCTSLVSIDLPKALSLGYQTLSNCSKLTDVNLPLVQTLERGVFLSCRELESIELPHAITVGESTLGSCDKLKQVTMPEATTFGDRVFEDCPLLESVTLPKAETFGDRAFAICPALVSINLPSAESFGSHAFMECGALQSAILPQALSIGRSGFYKCYALADLDLSSIQSFGTFQMYKCARPMTMKLGATPPVESGQAYPGGDCDVFENSANRKCNKILIPRSAIPNYPLNYYGKYWYTWSVDSLGDDASLSSLKIDGQSIPGFASGTYTYNMGKTTASAIQIEALASDGAAGISGDTGNKDISYGDNTFTVTVTAEDGTTTKNYAINICRGYEMAYSAGPNGSLSGDANQIAGPGRVGTEVTAVPDPGYKFVSWSDGSAVAARTDAPTDSNISLSATFAALSSDASLSSLKVDGQGIPGFAPATYTYDMEKTTASAIQIEALASDGAAGISGDTGNKDISYGDNTFTVTVTAEDGTTTKNYAINICRGYEMAYSAGSGGSITGSALQIVAPGRAGTEVTAVPDPGYKFVSWSDGSAVAARTDAPTDSNISLSATFAANSTGSKKKKTTTVEIDGIKFSAGSKSYSYDDDGNKEATLNLSDRTVATMTERLEEGSLITIPVTGKCDTATVEISLKSVEELKKKEMILELASDAAYCSIPTSLLDIDSMLGFLGQGTETGEIEFSVSISPLGESRTGQIESALEKRDMEMEAVPVEFLIEANYRGTTYEVKRFEGFLKKRMRIPTGKDIGRITTAVVIEPDGTMRSVPTYVKIVNGRYMAEINSLTNSTYTLIYNQASFTDVTDSHWARADIEKMASKLVVEGRADGTFLPDQEIRRAELAEILVKALGIEPVETEKFCDIEKGSEQAAYIGAAYTYGIVKGTGETTFDPESRVTRQDAMTMIRRAGAIAELENGQIGPGMAGYLDYPDVSDYAKEAVEWNIRNGIIIGKSATSIAPMDKITRAEMSAVVNRLLMNSGLIE